MLTILVQDQEFFNDFDSSFVRIPKTTLVLEHSLLSLSKWESKWHKPFLSSDLRTREESIDYIRCMTVTPNVDPMVYTALTPENIREINEYIDNPMTATTFSTNPQARGSHSKQVITAEIIYYWMISFQIPFECQKWHLNRLLTLIRVCEIKNSPKKKRKGKDLLSYQKALNDARLERYHTNG